MGNWESHCGDILALRRLPERIEPSRIGSTTLDAHPPAVLSACRVKRVRFCELMPTRAMGSGCVPSLVVTAGHRHEMRQFVARLRLTEVVHFKSSRDRAVRFFVRCAMNGDVFTASNPVARTRLRAGPDQTGFHSRPAIFSSPRTPRLPPTRSAASVLPLASRTHPAYRQPMFWPRGL